MLRNPSESFYTILQSKRETSPLEVSQRFHVFFKRPYVGIIQIRLWVEGFSFLSACKTSSPLCLLVNFIIYLSAKNGKTFTLPSFLDLSEEKFPRWIDFFPSACYHSSKKGLPLWEGRSVRNNVPDRLTSVRRSFSYQFLCKKHKVITPMITKLY